MNEQRRPTGINNYTTFLAAKTQPTLATGREVPPADLSPVLFDFQRAITSWAIRKGRAAIFADCGLGKTLMQLEWARHAGGTCLIVAPLTVSEQTIAEGHMLGLNVNRARAASDIAPGGLNIANYERIRSFTGAPLDAISNIQLAY